MSDSVNVAAASREFELEVTKGNQAKDDMVMMMQPFTDMEGRLSAAPLCLSILGQICLIATGRDFSLVDSKDKDSLAKFKHLTHPDSFRASLCQLSNEGYMAFLEAHRVMDVIRLSTHQVPGLMTQSLNILFKASTHEVERHLPISLGRIREIADKCTKEAEAVVAKYNKVIDTLHELQAASFSKQGKVEEAKRVADFEAKQKKDEQAELAKMKAQIDSHYEESRKRMEEAQKDYKDALKSMPGAGTLFLLALGDGALAAVKAVPNLISGKGILGSVTNTGVSTRASHNGVGNHEAAADPGESFPTKMLHSKAKGIQATITSIGRFFAEKSGQLALNDDAVQGTKRTGDGDAPAAKEIEKAIETLMESIAAEKAKGGNKELANTLSEICKRIKTLASEINAASEQGARTSAKQVEEFKEKFEKLEKVVDEIALQSSVALQNPAIEKKGPGLAKMAGGGGGDSLVERTLQSAHTKLELTKEQMHSTQKSADEAMKEQLAVNRELTETMMKIAKFEAESASFAEVMDVLSEGLKAFGALKKQWTKLQLFFQMMTNLINTSLGPPLKMFVQHAKEIGDDRLVGREASTFLQDQIYQIAHEAVKWAYVVNNLSGAYCEISSDHMMPLVASLGSLIALDKAKDADKIRAEKDALASKAEGMQKTIEEIIRAKNKKLREQLERRSSEIQQAFDRKIPPIAPEKKAQIQKDVREAVERAGDPIEELDMADFS